MNAGGKGKSREFMHDRSFFYGAVNGVAKTLWWLEDDTGAGKTRQYGTTQAIHRTFPAISPFCAKACPTSQSSAAGAVGWGW